MLDIEFLIFRVFFFQHFKYVTPLSYDLHSFFKVRNWRGEEKREEKSKRIEEKRGRKGKGREEKEKKGKGREKKKKIHSLCRLVLC